MQTTDVRHFENIFSLGEDPVKGLHNEITCLYLGVINCIYMFRVWGLNMLMLVRGIVGRSDVNDVSKWGFPQAAIVAVSTGGPVCASRL